MFRTLFFVLLAAFFVRCEKAKEYLPAENYITDSFSIQNISELDEFMTFHFIDSIAYSYSGNTSMLYFYKKDGKRFLMQRKHFLTETGPAFHSFFINQEGQINIIDGNNDWILFNKQYKKEKVAHFVGEKKFLKDDYILTGLPTIPFLQKQDTLVSTYYYRTPQSYAAYFQEPSITESVIKDDSVYFIRDYIAKPDNLIDYCVPFPKYCFKNNLVSLIYPCFDSLYLYDRNTGKLQRKHIGNRDYILPEKWDIAKLFSPEFNSYYSTYQLNNFQYKSIRYNPLTNHYLLFYVTPVVKNNSKNATFDDQKLKALVLDANGKILDYYQFEQKYFSPENFIWIDDKGFALPLFKSKFDYANTTFHIYNL